MRVKLNELISQLEVQFEEFSAYYNKKTGEFVEIENTFLNEIEEDDYDINNFSNESDWIKEDLNLAEDILFNNPDNYIPLPSRYDINDYYIMKRFSLYIIDDEISSILLNAISGRGAFRRFKDEICRLGLEEEWYKYKYEKYKEIAIEWCEDKGIEYEE